MNLLDENFPADQAVLLREWRLPCRQMGHDFARLETQDADIIPLTAFLPLSAVFCGGVECRKLI